MRIAPSFVDDIVVGVYKMPMAVHFPNIFSAIKHLNAKTEAKHGRGSDSFRRKSGSRN